MILAVALLLVTPFNQIEPKASQTSNSDQGRCARPGAAATADAMIAKFDDHQFVFIGSTHGDLKIEEFLMCLVTRPAFSQQVTDIVTEWAGSGQQRLLDQYILQLKEIPMEDLAPIWFDTDAPTLWTTLPQVREFVKTLREVNRKLPISKRIRLVGGNEGVDWTKVQSPEDLAPYPFKTNLVSHLLLEHLSKTPGNKTLVVYGDAHTRYKGKNFMGDLEATLGRPKLFVLGRIGELRAEERKYLVSVGDPERSFFVDSSKFPRDIPWPQSLRVNFEERSTNLADYIDAFVYLGSQPDRDMRGTVPLTPSQQRELDRRSTIKSDGQRTMRARFQGRSQWFRLHPDDFPTRPQQ